jgi:hypothetical protein
MALAVISVAVLVAVLGFFVRVGGHADFLMESREGRVEDARGMARWVGACLYMTSSALLLAGVLLYVEPEHGLPIGAGMYFVLLNLMVVYLAGAQRFLRKGYMNRAGRFVPARKPKAGIGTGKDKGDEANGSTD